MYLAIVDARNHDRPLGLLNMKKLEVNPHQPTLHFPVEVGRTPEYIQNATLSLKRLPWAYEDTIVGHIYECDPLDFHLLMRLQGFIQVADLVWEV